MNIVEAVKTEGEAEVIARKLIRNARGNSLYADIWRFGVNTALRISDLLSLTFEDVAGDRLVIKESKTGKTRHIDLNSSAKRIVAERKQAHPDHTFLFQVDSNRAKGKPVSRVAVANAFKAVGDELGIQLGTHSMRKTRGWLMYSGGVSIEKICRVLNHSSPAVTMAYIGLSQAEVDATYHSSCSDGPLTAPNARLERVFLWLMTPTTPRSTPARSKLSGTQVEVIFALIGFT